MTAVPQYITAVFSFTTIDQCLKTFYRGNLQPFYDNYHENVGI